MSNSWPRYYFGSKNTESKHTDSRRAESRYSASNCSDPKYAVTKIREHLNSPEHLLFSSNDLDEVKSMVGRVMQPHQLTILGNNQKIDAKMHYIPLGDISMSRLRYGASVEITPGELDSFFLIQMPLAGCAGIESGDQCLDSTPNLASILSPNQHTSMRWNADNDQFMVRISRSLLERTLVGQLGHPLDQPLVFELGFAWQRCQAWRCLMPYLLECTTQVPDILQHKLITNQIEQLISVTLLSTHQHNYSETPTNRRCSIRPRHVRRVQEYLQAHAHEPITVEQLAQVAGVSLRSLYSGFKEFLNISPMQYLRDLRMAHVRTELLAGEATSVTGVALRWGFAHMGRFSAEYKARYGETPSKSLKRG
ncbi:AraC-like DNA-binding protein [Xenorhabdus ehlersii]|uniref:AraC family transcription regulator n=1 Tax=Xenorhabdus ehlersii TaxID=290111 RepID=A0A2D0IYS7_9GAMM|nr:AraC family transcription regulator [Xenorhabdus sp. TS4]PHM27072.1 AraC family transcription regulator [Xenorhabdus ehlersii]RKE92513.1 AraC-like DNA-binding protein [Xenorhabdus ehlersii]